MNDETKKGTSPVRRLRANRTPRNRGAGMVFVQQASAFPNDQRAHSQGAERGDRAMDRGDECTKLLRKLARIDVDGQSAEHVANLAIQYAAEARRLLAPARPTAAREDTELRSLVDRLREEFVKLHTEAISRRDNGLPENWSRYENDRSHYEGVIEEIDAARNQGGKTP